VTTAEATRPLPVLMPGVFRHLVHVILPDARVTVDSHGNIYWAACNSPCRRLPQGCAWQQWPACQDCLTAMGADDPPRTECEDTIAC
jgi:hypothetical protein